MRLAIFLLILMAPGMAWAQSWTTTSGGSDTISVLNPDRTGFRYAYYDFSDTTDSAILNTEQCPQVVVCLNPDKDGANTGAAGYVRGCLTNVASATECVQIQVDGLDQTLTGDGATNRACVAVWSPWIFFDVTANAGADNALVSAFCVR